MNESEENKELIQRIAETLRNHAEPYQEGAWERFAAAQGITRKRILWPYWSAAAVLLVAVSLFLVTSTSDSPTPTIADVRIEKGQSITSAPSEPIAPAESEQTTAMGLSAKTEASSTKRMAYHAQRNTNVGEARKESLVVAQAPVVARNIATERVDEENTEIYQPDVAMEIERETPDSVEHRLAVVEQPVVPKLSVEHATRGSEYAAIEADMRGSNARKWDVGVAVAPSMTSKKLNLSGGIAVAYQLSDKFSVGSGVSIGRLGIGENPNYDPSAGSSPPMAMEPSPGGRIALADKREQYKRDITLTSNVVALDIPLDLRYEVLSGFYASVGVSYVAVLSEQRTEHFIGGLNEATLSDKGATKNLEASTTVGYVSEKMDVQPLRGKGYTGFMNFSVGRKVSVSKHLFFSIEPYFKLPIGQLSKEQMDFTNGGIRIITGF